MATTFAAPETDMIQFSFPISKWEKDDDGDIVVKGVATDGTIDSDEQIVDTDWSSKALADWLDTGGNVRMSHDPHRPVGKGLQVEIDRDGDGKHWVKSLIVDSEAKRLVEKGVLTAYSVGISRPVIAYDKRARGGVIKGGQICELSIVDRPANKSCYLELAKSDKSGNAEWVGKMFGLDVLNKSEVVNVDVPKSASITFSPTDLAKLLEHRKVAEERLAKRDMDPDVGGGVDRDKIPAEDFAGVDRSFPIVTPKDVHDAALSLGRARGQDTDKIKSRIISIARRKGDAFVAQLPDEWKGKAVAATVTEIMGVDVSSVDPAVRKALTEAPLAGKGKKKKAFPGAAPAFDGTDSDHDGADTDKPGSEEDDDTRKPPKVKPGSSKKAAEAAEEAAVDDADVEKGGGKSCKNCGKNYHADSKLKNCENCGTKLPIAKAAEPDADEDDEDTADEEKASKPTPDGDAVGSGADDMKPVPEHREPDGSAIEAFESDAGLPTTRDSSVKTVMRLKSLGVPQDVGSLHDMLCPGFHPSEVSKCYPNQSLAGISVEDWQEKALIAATSAPLSEAAAATTMWQNAVTIKGTEPEVLMEIMAEAHKSFQDANPGPGTFPTPSELSATRFRRGYISAGHANPGTSYGGPNTHSIPSGTISADQFSGGYQSAGRAQDSPSNKADNPVPAPVPAGEPNRVYYRNTQRDHAKNAMQAMHDHIASTFPDLCPMGGGNGVGGEAPVGQRPVPVPGSTKTEKKPKKAKVEPTLEKAFSPDLIKSAVAEATAPLFERLETLAKALNEEKARSEALQKAVDALGSMADPREAPFKGIAMNPVTAKRAPVGALSVAEIAERAQQQKLAALEQQWRYDEDPGAREAAWAEFSRMTGLINS